jgi:hypothetical protein
VKSRLQRRAADHAGGRSELIQPLTLSDSSGSGRSQVRHCMVTGILPSLVVTKIILRPHRGQF